ncbi:Flp family type IVb pilin [Inquilinus sp. CAU 1745]|uniref:Flp family type IVb pilin n=1 Tax=Inquilinus sp. CAU 1745 TaxID=3140369 RepID=UPI00325AD27D
MFSVVRRFIRNESGATAIEYGLIAALVSVAAIFALTAMGGSLEGMFQTVCESLEGAMAGGDPASCAAPADDPAGV